VGTVLASLARARGLLRPAVETLSRENRQLSNAKAQLIDADEELSEAETAAQRLLDVARGVEIPTGPLARETVDASEVLRLTLRLMQNELRVLQSLEIDHRPVPLVAGSSAQLGQIILNMLVSALDAMSIVPRSKRKLAVRLFFDEPWVKIEFSDSGPALTDDLLSQDFDPWNRGSGPRGQGLGLAISKAILEEVGGRLEAENSASGVVFRVSLPKCKSMLPAAPEA